MGVYCRELLNGLLAAQPGQRFQWWYRPHRLKAGWREAHTAGVPVRPLFDAVPFAWPDLFHGLNQRMPAVRFRRSVCTFHDLFVMTSEYSTPEFRTRFTAQARAAAARADLIVCVSSFTADQVHDLLQVERGRLRVIPHGTHAPAELSGEPRQPLVLHVGAIQHRKNLLRLVEAFERVAPPGWRLVLAGSDGFGAAEIHDRIRTSPACERIETPGYVDDAALEVLYRRASIFAFPSLDEGFGIPVLEAMGQGLPVLSSNRSALPEACGGAALLVNPLRVDELAEALRRLMSDEDLRLRMSRAGRARVREATWAEAVASTWSVYEELLR